MTYHIVFDATDPKSPRFIELEDSTGHSISAGEWRERKDGYVELVLPAPLSKYCTQTLVTPATDADIVRIANKKGMFNHFEILSLIARIRASETVWQDIATAPRDGTRFLAAEPEDGWLIGICLWCKTPHVPLYGFHFTHGDPEDWDIAHPTLWCPLPSPPKPLSYEGDQS